MSKINLRKCNICGCLYDYNTCGRYKFKLKVLTGNGYDSWSWTKYDICKECQDALEEFINQKQDRKKYSNCDPGFGYQPKDSGRIPSPPTSGSVIIKSKEGE